MSNFRINRFDVENTVQWIFYHQITNKPIYGIGESIEIPRHKKICRSNLCHRKCQTIDHFLLTERKPIDIFDKIRAFRGYIHTFLTYLLDCALSGGRSIGIRLKTVLFCLPWILQSRVIPRRSFAVSHAHNPGCHGNNSRDNQTNPSAVIAVISLSHKLHMFYLLRWLMSDSAIMLVLSITQTNCECLPVLLIGISTGSKFSKPTYLC